MCNDYRSRVPAEQIIGAFRQIRLELSFPAGIPNLEPREDIRIKDTAPVVRWNGSQAELVQMPWPWSAPNPYHDRQVVVLTPDSWEAWLTGSVPEADVLKAGPAGSLAVEPLTRAA